MFSFLKSYKTLLAFSAALMIASIASLVFFGLNLGIDFKGGSLLELKFKQDVAANSVASDLTAAGFGNVVVQPSGDRQVLIKTEELSSQEDRAKLLDTLKNKFGEYEELRSDSIGPVIGTELRQKAFWQTGLVILGILFYIAYAFRKLGGRKSQAHASSWRLSLAAVIALLHDLLIVLGVFALLGRFHNVEIDSLFITALLTVLGFSVHDTIVVFDRLRENLQRELGYSFAETVNYSVNQTLVRSINTSMTVLFVLLALALFGGASIYYFVLALLIGIGAGTYSSIFVASALLLLWNRE